MLCMYITSNKMVKATQSTKRVNGWLAAIAAALEGFIVGVSALTAALGGLMVRVLLSLQH